jgi:hypothetical protein
VRTFIVIVLLSAFVGVTAFPGQSRTTWSFHTELDMFLALKAGAEYQFSDSFGIRGTLGTCVIAPAQISYTLVGVSHFRKPENEFQLDLQFGLVQAVFTIVSANNPYTYWVPGACISLGYRFASRHQVGIRAGAGVLFGYDLGAWRGPAFQPNLAVEYSWRIP